VRQAVCRAKARWFWGAHAALLFTGFTGTKVQILTPKAAVRQVVHRAMGRWFWGAHPELLFRVMLQQFVELVKRGEYEVYLPHFTRFTSTKVQKLTGEMELMQRGECDLHLSTLRALLEQRRRN